MKVTKRQLRRIIKEEKAKLNEVLPSHLQKHFRADGSSVKDPEWEDVTPAGYGPDVTSKVGGISQALIDDYNSWVHKEGHVTPAASSVLATYLITNRMEEDHDAHQMMADFFSLEHEDVMRDINRQQSERSATMGEGTEMGNMPDSWRQILGNCLGD
tara:strand:- start:276 stop:746 length:471 start_codon:yes stop_codon:yes gene_type:complete